MDTDPANEVNKDTQSIKILLQKQNRPATADRLRRYLLFLMVLLPSLTIFSLLFFSNLNNGRVLQNQARVLLKNTTTESIRQAESFIEAAENELRLSFALYKNEVIQAGDRQILEDYYISQLELNSSVASMYSGNENGDFLYISRSQESDKAKYRVKTIQRTEDGVVTRIWWRNPESEPIDLHTIPDDGYDPRERPWYQEAKNSMELIWTDPYVFFTTQRLGVTTAMPLVNDAEEAIGAIGVDLELTELAEFLNNLEVSNFGSSFITAAEGQLIASASMMERYKNTTDQLELQILNEKNTQDELASLAYQAVRNTTQNATFQKMDNNYLVESMPLTLSRGTKWWIVTFSPENEFLSAIRSSQKNEYLIAGLITALSMLLGLFLARFTWKPIAEMEQKANYDQLTQLFNRNYLEDHADEIVNKAIDNEQPLSVAILDIDLFKPINDTYGHDVGDIVLQIFAIRLLNQRRPLDTVLRYGGEEFIVIMPNTTAELAASVIDNARVAMSSRLYEINDYILKVTFSAGVAELNDENKTLKDIMKAADIALYRSKHQGRDQVNIAHKDDIQTIINHT